MKVTPSFSDTHPTMLYAPTIRSRRRPINFKLGYTFALHLRHSRTLSIVAILLTLPFFSTVILSILQPLPNQTRNSLNPTHIHHSTNITIPQYLREQARRRKTPVPPDHSISLIAACMNRPESLGLTLPSWEAIPQINEIVLVDWASTTSMTDIPNNSTLLTTGRLSLIRVDNAESWILSRAYNLASKFATGRYIIKVDCDIHLADTFLQNQPLPPDGRYFSTWGSQRDSNQQNLRGVWFGHANDFRIVGGYDERIVGYGYEDIDLYRRFDAFLERIPLNLDHVRHSNIGDIVWRASTSKRISPRINEALLSKLTTWGETLAAGHASHYEYRYNNRTLVLHAAILNAPQSANEKLLPREVQRIKTGVLLKALHNDFHIPWDVVTTINMADLKYLAEYLDNDQGSSKKIIITILEEQEALSVLFNLVSAVQLGITTGRPVIMIWRHPSKENLLSKLVNIPEVNGRLAKVTQTIAARRHGFSSASRLVVARKWNGSAFGDAAYKHFVNVLLTRGKVYDESYPIPLPVRDHAVVKLSTEYKLGGTETRALAYRCIEFTDIVTRKVGLFESQVGFIAESFSMSLLESVKSESGKGKRAGVVGRAVGKVRESLGFDRFCGTVCGVEEMGMEMGNVLAVVVAERTVPEVGDGSRGESETEQDRVYGMVADLRGLHRQLRAG